MIISGIKTFTFSLRDHQNPFARFATEPLIQPVRGFTTMKTAYATIKGFEVMRALRKGQLGLFSFEAASRSARQSSPGAPRGSSTRTHSAC